MHNLSVKKNLFVLRSLLNDLSYFWNKFCNFPFLAICRSQFAFLIFLGSSWYVKAKIERRTSLRNKKNLVNRKTCYKTKSNLSQFYFSYWLLYECFFSFVIKTFVNFEKLIRFHRQAFILYKNRENLKILKEKPHGFERYFGLFRLSET